MCSGRNISTGREVGRPERSLLYFRKADLQLDGRDELHQAGTIPLNSGMTRWPEVDVEAGLVGLNSHFQTVGPRPDQNISARANDLFKVRRKITGQAISQSLEESKQADAIRMLTGPVRFSEWNSQVARCSGVGDQVELVVHLVADGNCGAANQISVRRSEVVWDERPFAIVVQGQRHARHAAATGPRSQALQANSFKFLNRLLRSMHAALPAFVDATTGAWFQNARPA